MRVSAFMPCEPEQSSQVSIRSEVLEQHHRNSEQAWRHSQCARRDSTKRRSANGKLLYLVCRTYRAWLPANASNHNNKNEKWKKELRTAVRGNAAINRSYTVVVIDKQQAVTVCAGNHEVRSNRTQTHPTTAPEKVNKLSRPPFHEYNWCIS